MLPGYCHPDIVTRIWNRMFLQEEGGGGSIGWVKKRRPSIAM
jgi:hypothetical protein